MAARVQTLRYPKPAVGRADPEIQAGGKAVDDRQAPGERS